MKEFLTRQNILDFFGHAYKTQREINLVKEKEK